MTQTLLRTKQVSEKTGISQSQLRRMVEVGTFPTGIKVSEKMLCWSGEAVGKWITDRLDRIDMPDGTNWRYDQYGHIVPASQAA